MKIEIEVTPEEEKLIKKLAKNAGLPLDRFILFCIYFFKKEIENT